MMPEFAEITEYAGLLALAAFAGVYLGGLALSFTWNTFGPWNQLKACSEELNACRAHREEDREIIAKLQAALASHKVQHLFLVEALKNAGLQLTIGTGEEGDHNDAE